MIKGNTNDNGKVSDGMLLHSSTGSGCEKDDSLESAATRVVTLRPELVTHLGTEGRAIRSQKSVQARTRPSAPIPGGVESWTLRNASKPAVTQEVEKIGQTHGKALCQGPRPPPPLGAVWGLFGFRQGAGIFTRK